MQQRRIKTPLPTDALRRAPTDAGAPLQIEDLGLVIVYWGSEVGLVSETLGRTLCYLASARPPAALVSQASKSLSLDELIEAVSDECRAKRQHHDGRHQEASSSEERDQPACGNWEAAAHFLRKHLPGHRALLREG